MSGLSDEQRKRTVAFLKECRDKLMVIADEAGVKGCDAEECYFPLCMAHGCEPEEKEGP